MSSAIEKIFEDHPLLPLMSIIIEISLSAKLDPVNAKRISYELIKVSGRKADDLGPNLSGEYFIIDLAIKSIVKRYLQHLAQLFNTLMTAEETYKVLIAANEPFKKTRRRLPPRAEADLSDWLNKNSKHPYMSDEDIEDFCENYEGIEVDQVRIFLTNARRKMSEGVRKRTKSQ